MNHILPKTTRKDKLKGWMAEHGWTYMKLGAALGMSNVGARKSLMSDAVTLERIKEFKRLGFPGRLLPKAKPET